MLKRVQHDNRVRVSFFCHPELVSGSRFLVLRIWVLKPRPVGGALYLQSKLMPLYANHFFALGDASSFFVSDFAPEEFSYL